MDRHELPRFLKKLSLVIFLFSVFCPLFSGFGISQPADLPQQTQEAVTQSQPGSGKISLDIKDMEITDVLKMLALRSGKNIVAGKNVRGKVKVFLKDVEVMDALEIILISNELAYDMKGDIINVMTDRDYEAIYGERFQDAKAVKVVKLRYAKASEVSKALNQLKSRIGKIVVDEISNTIVIMDAPQTAAQMERLAVDIDLPTQTRVFALNYSKAETMKTKLEPLLTKGIGTIQVDERTNKVVISDLESNIKAIETAVSEFDEKTKQVLIEAKILQITLNDEYKAGINWDTVFNGIRTQLGMNFNVITGSPIPTTAAGAVTAGGIHVGALEKTNYEAMVKFLQTFGKTNLLASPRIAAINNEEAKILVGTNQPYVESSTLTSSSSPTQTNYVPKFIDLGVKLYVTPTINRDGFITMKVKPEVSSTSSDYTYGPNKDTLPIVKTSQAETTVMLKDGSTIVIAGLIENREEEVVNKVPGLGDAPLIGSIFRNRTRGSATNPEKNELVIFLTPRIISGEAISPEVEKYEALTDKLEMQLTQKEIKELARQLKREDEGLSLEEKTQMAEAEKVMQETDLAAKAAKKEDATKEITMEEYYNVVRKKILEKVTENYPAAPVKGEVQLSFCVAQDGTLKGIPALLKPADPMLKESAIRSVKASSPFPAFPKNFTRSEEVFKISIVYE